MTNTNTNDISLKIVSFNIWGLPDILNRAPSKINQYNIDGYFAAYLKKEN